MRNINARITKKDRDELVLALQNAARDKAYFEALLKDLLTPAEINEFVARFQIVKRLVRGETQRDIASALHVALVTVGRGSRALEESSGGFSRYFA
jgi:Trp operon repressor